VADSERNTPQAVASILRCGTKWPPGACPLEKQASWTHFIPERR